MQIADKMIPGHTVLAPMAGVGDSAFRALCRSYGCSLVVSEMISAKALTLGDKKSRDLLFRRDIERPFSIQLFGDDPAIMAAAAEMVMDYGPDFIDINMGCPAPKITQNGCGSRLMLRPERAFAVVAAVVAAVDVPVTVKMRKGWDESSVNAVEMALGCQQAGAAAITVHGKTREQMYAPQVDLDIIRAVKEAVAVPVIGNGDIAAPEDARRMLDETGCDAVMVGRAALGHPWLFGQIESYLQSGRYEPAPAMPQRMEVLQRHARMCIEEKGERRAMLLMRTHAAWYIKGVRGAAKLRAMTGSLSTFEDLEALCATVCDES
ncbi:tRNA dihydrouridine synthase DusB [Neobittarella massiliensis]|uniref:tRNA dihydrouridine synthase DusB n=1 Tax=Neobittarella massiliensis (ex Bilen et al. 2018) TaxID=2041842 RepID=UPI000CF72646|nr:tRNA dihydrouridine synthase DusB [Neobittarella massiliensis]